MSQTVTIIFDDPGHQREFRSYETIIAWIQEEQRKWAWLNGHGHGGIGSQNSTSYANMLQGVINHRDGGQPLSTISGVVQQYYQPSGPLRHSEGSLAKQIEQLRETHSDDAAAFAIAFSRNVVSLGAATTPAQLAACILLSMPEFEKPDAIAHRLEAERRNYRHGISSQLDRIDAAAEERDLIFSKHLHTARRLAIRQLLRTRKTDRTMRTSLARQSLDAIASIRGVEETFSIKMGLQAPVKYWEDKATKHRKSAADAVTRLKWFFPAAALTFLVAFGLSAWLLLSSDTVHQTVYVIVAAGLASLAALIFWVGRLLTKLYLSQHHLLHDAEERAVMTTTYLALSHENAASEEDKKIVLGALFRPTVDGLVKDDGPSELSLAGALSRLGVAR